MKNKLTFNLIVIIVASIALLTGIMMPIYLYLQPNMYIEQEIKYVAQFSEKLKAVEPFDQENLSEFVTNSRENYRIYIFDENFEPLYTSYEFGNNKKFLERLFSSKLESFSESSKPYYTEVDNDPSVRLSTCCEKNGELYYIYIKDSHSGVSFVFDFSNNILGGVVIAFVIISSVILFFSISPSIKSVEKITEVAKNISANNLSVRYQGKIPKNEIGELALSVNAMADTIQENINHLENYNFILSEDNRYLKEYEQLRHMLLRNVTHDLKTPLAVISSQVEMINTCQNQEDKDYYFESAIEEINKMSKMISDVLQMTVDERRIISKKEQLLDISELVTQLCNNCSAYIKSRKLELKTDITPNLKLNTVREYMEFVFRNYISNAVKNSKEKTSITVSLKECDGTIRLSVENVGEHISDTMKDKIWTETYTSSPKGNDNTGLGLYIVKEISLIEHTSCGFDNTKTGVRFWFDFTDSNFKNSDAL